VRARLLGHSVLGHSASRLEPETLLLKFPSCTLARPVSCRPVENGDVWTRPKGITRSNCIVQKSSHSVNQCCVDPRTITDYVLVWHWFTGFHNRDGVCLLTGMKWLFQLNSGYLRPHSPLLWQYFNADVRVMEDYIQIPRSCHCNIHLKTHAIALPKPSSKECFHFTYFVYTWAQKSVHHGLCRKAEISEPFNTTVVISRTYFIILLPAWQRNKIYLLAVCLSANICRVEVENYCDVKIKQHI